MWYDEFNSIFFLTVVSLTFGSIVVCKCLWVSLNIHRNVQVEEEIELGMNRPVELGEEKV